MGALFLVFPVAAAAIPAHAEAQTFRGMIVDDSTKRPLADATVRLLDRNGRDLGKSARTDSLGRFTLHIGVIGSYQAQAARIGYQPLISRTTAFNGGEVVTVNFSLRGIAQQLGRILVTERRRYTRDELLSPVGFELRRSRGVGLFLDSTHLAQFNRSPISNVLEDYSTVPAVFPQFTDFGPRLRMITGINPKGWVFCYPQLFIDGWAVEHWRAFGLGADEIHGMEIYSRALLPPPSLGAIIGDYMGAPPARQCGAIAIWTKRYYADFLARQKKKS